VEDSNQLLDEISKLKTAKKDILENLEERSKSVRQTETQLKMKQNEIEVLSNSHQMSKDKMDQYKKKLEKLEVEVNELRSRAQKAEREKGNYKINHK
jgi:peptidoglycan hydrolase CwlO-like protein